MHTEKPLLLLILRLGLILWWLPGPASASQYTTTHLAPNAPTVSSSATLSVTLSPSKDNTLYEDPGGALSNGAGQYFFVGRTAQATNSIRRGLIEFDIAGNIPTGSLVVSATLQLTMSKTIAGSQPVALHRLTADWGEGTSTAVGEEGSGAAATPGDATWIHTFYTSTLWTAPGGDFVVTASATATVGSVGAYTWSAAGMVSDVQTWLDAPQANYGWLLLGNETTLTTAKRFNTREHSSPTARPVLIITYTYAIYLPTVLK